MSPALEEPLEEPLRPENDDCCGGGSCNPCVWDAFYKKRQKWEEQQLELLTTSEKNK